MKRTLTMKKALVACAVVSATMGALPAMAAVERVGSVDFRYRMDNDRTSFNLGGPVESLYLTAERSDVRCRSVTARFGNGRDREIFSGVLRQGRTTSVDLPGGARDLNGLYFNCGAEDRRGASVRISAEVGRYQADWRRNPDWNRVWSRVFNWGSNQVNDWQPVSTLRFEGRGDTEVSAPGWRGRRVDAIALMPVEADARCSRVTARFERGPDRNLNVSARDVLRRGQYFRLDLPGETRNVTAINARCSAVGARNVSVRVFTSH